MTDQETRAEFMELAALLRRIADELEAVPEA